MQNTNEVKLSDAEQKLLAELNTKRERNSSGVSTLIVKYIIAQKKAGKNIIAITPKELGIDNYSVQGCNNALTELGLFIKTGNRNKYLAQHKVKKVNDKLNNGYVEQSIIDLRSLDVSKFVAK
jgi:hypothetical protein